MPTIQFAAALDCVATRRVLVCLALTFVGVFWESFAAVSANDIASEETARLPEVLDLATATEFHLQFGDVTRRVSSRLVVQYMGPLARRSDATGWQSETTNEWAVGIRDAEASPDSAAPFVFALRVWASPQRDSIAAIRLNERLVYVTVCRIRSSASADSKLDELRGISVRELVRRVGCKDKERQ